VKNGKQKPISLRPICLTASQRPGRNWQALGVDDLRPQTDSTAAPIAGVFAVLDGQCPVFNRGTGESSRVSAWVMAYVTQVAGD